MSMTDRPPSGCVEMPSSRPRSREEGAGWRFGLSGYSLHNFRTSRGTVLEGPLSGPPPCANAGAAPKGGSAAQAKALPQARNSRVRAAGNIGPEWEDTAISAH
jgi:hypothetical protein